MNKQMIALTLVAALAVPGLAQQETSSPPSEPAASQASSAVSQPGAAQSPADQPPDQAKSQRQPGQYEVREGFWGKLNPFARKKYVRRQLDPVRGRVSELDELTATNAKAIKDVDARAQEGIRQAGAKANEADQHAVDAGNRAQVAHQTAQDAGTRLQNVEQAVDNVDQYHAVSQIEIRFRPGQMALNQKAKEALDDLATPLQNQKGYVVEVQGFASGGGQEALQNSRRMAESVVRYLVLNYDIPVFRVFVVSMGNAPLPASTEGGKPRRTFGGRVEVSLLRNGIADLDRTPQPQSSPAARPKSDPNRQTGMNPVATGGELAQTLPQSSKTAAASLPGQLAAPKK